MAVVLKAWMLIPVAILVAFSGGWLLGRRGLPRGQPTVTQLPVAWADAGPMPLEVAKATGGGATCDAGVVITIVPGPIRWVPQPYMVASDAGFNCPSCPALTVSASTSSSAAPCTAYTQSPVLPPTLLHETDSPRLPKAFGVGVAGGYAVGKAVIGGTADWTPTPWLDIRATVTISPLWAHKGARRRENTVSLGVGLEVVRGLP